MAKPEENLIKIDLRRFVEKTIAPAIRCVLGSLLVEVLDQFHRQEDLYGVNLGDLDGKTMAMLESIKDEIASRFMGCNDDLKARLGNLVTLRLLRETNEAIAKKKDKE